MKFNMAVTAETINCEIATYAEPEQLSSPHLSAVRILRVVIRVLQIHRDVNDSNPIPDLEETAAANGAALASSPSLGSFEPPVSSRSQLTCFNMREILPEKPPAPRG
jgi:hypothetical protein